MRYLKFASYEDFNKIETLLKEGDEISTENLINFLDVLENHLDDYRTSKLLELIDTNPNADDIVHLKASEIFLQVLLKQKSKNYRGKNINDLLYGALGLSYLDTNFLSLLIEFTLKLLSESSDNILVIGHLFDIAKRPEADRNIKEKVIQETLNILDTAKEWHEVKELIIDYGNPTLISALIENINYWSTLIDIASSEKISKDLRQLAKDKLNNLFLEEIDQTNDVDSLKENLQSYYEDPRYFATEETKKIARDKISLLEGQTENQFEKNSLLFKKINYFYKYAVKY